eukprot:COSAG01_NODE_3808_length_5677_cov_7.172643_5_plen_223_part_00
MTTSFRRVAKLRVHRQAKPLISATGSPSKIQATGCARQRATVEPCTVVHGPTDPYVAQYNTVQLYSRRKLAGIQRSLRKYRISRNRRNLQNRNSAAAEIAIRFGPKILLKCVSRKTGPKYPCTTVLVIVCTLGQQSTFDSVLYCIRINTFDCTGLDYGYKSSFSLNHRFNPYGRRITSTASMPCMACSCAVCVAWLASAVSLLPAAAAGHAPCPCCPHPYLG